jgi:hypothetical protein
VTVLPTDHPFRRHSENLRAIKAGLVQAERAHKDAIRRADSPAIGFTARIHQFMIGLLAEAQLRAIVSDPDGFNSKEQRILAQERSQLDRWLRSVEFAVRRHYSVPLHLEIDDTNTTTGVSGQYEAITDLLKNDLAPVIEDRNKVAHAQWKWLLNSKESDFKGLADPSFNYLAAKRRGDLIVQIASLVHALAVSEPTFQRDYREIYGKIIAIKADINGRDYPDFVKELRARRQVIRTEVAQ